MLLAVFASALCGRVFFLDYTDLFLCSCSRRSCSSLSRCSLACLRFSARTRAASSGLLVPADGLLAGAVGVEAVEAGAAVEAAAVVVTEGAAAAAAADGSTLGAAEEADVTTGGLREGGVTGAEDTTMAGTLEEAVRETTKRRREIKRLLFILF